MHEENFEYMQLTEEELIKTLRNTKNQIPSELLLYEVEKLTEL